jgi:hypothetical protein
VLAGTGGGLRRGTSMPHWGISNSGNPGRALTTRPGEPGLLELVLEGHADGLGPVVLLVDAEENRGPGHAGPQQRRESIRLPVLLAERLEDVEELAVRDFVKWY